MGEQAYDFEDFEEETTNSSVEQSANSTPNVHAVESQPESKEQKVFSEPHGYTPRENSNLGNNKNRSKYVLIGGWLVATLLAFFAAYKFYAYEQLLNSKEISAIQEPRTVEPTLSSEQTDSVRRTVLGNSVSPVGSDATGFGSEVLQTKSTLERAVTKVNPMEVTKQYGANNFDPVGFKPHGAKSNALGSTVNMPLETSNSENIDNQWVLSQLKGSDIKHGKKILQLEAQVALLQLDLAKQKEESFKAMQAASEAASTILAAREILRKLVVQVKDVQGKVDANEKNYAALLERITPQIKRLEKQSDVQRKPSAPSRSLPSTREASVSEPKREILRSYETVLVSERAAYVVNVHNNERRLLEIGTKYSDLGRVKGVNKEEKSVYGVTGDGLSWVIKKSKQ